MTDRCDRSQKVASLQSGQTHICSAARSSNQSKVSLTICLRPALIRSRPYTVLIIPSLSAPSFTECWGCIVVNGGSMCYHLCISCMYVYLSDRARIFGNQYNSPLPWLKYFSKYRFLQHSVAYTFF